jgi:hypothetical protein
MFDEFFAGLAIRPLTQKLISQLLLDLPLTPAMLVDFGVDSENHYRALKEVLSVEEEGHPDQDERVIAAQATERLRQRIVELNAAIGNGTMLNALVKKYAPQYTNTVQFCTSMDVITGRTEPSEE